MTNFVFNPVENERKQAVQQLFGSLRDHENKNDHGRVEAARPKRKVLAVHKM